MSSNAKKLLEGGAFVRELLFVQLVTLKVVWFSREIASNKRRQSLCSVQDIEQGGQTACDKGKKHS